MKLGAPVELPEGEAKRSSVTAMFDRVAPSYERLNRIISLGQDRRWRDRTLRDLDLPPGSIVVDLACGTGDLTRSLHATGVTAIGIDLSPGMLAYAHAPGPLVRGDALSLPIRDASVDGVVCGFALRNFVDVSTCFAECARVVRPGGRVAFLDAAQPSGRLARAGHAVWFRHAVPRIGAWLSDGDAYRYLPASTAYLPDGDELQSRLTAAGFDAVTRHTIMTGAVQILSGSRTR